LVLKSPFIYYFLALQVTFILENLKVFSLFSGFILVNLIIIIIQTMSRKAKIIGILLVGVLVVAISINYVFNGGTRDLATEEVAFTVSSKDIIGEFTSNVIIATNKYSDKAISISGKVTAVSDSIVTLDNTIICNFKIPDTNIKNDQSINVKGRLVGFDDLMGELKLDQCSINENK
jgi:hypothetical protein